MTTEPKKTVQDAWARWAIEQLQIKLSTVGGFDPNEDPVIIGSGAAGAAGSTPSALNAGDTGSVILGLNAAVVSGTSFYGDVVAIGHSVSVGGTGLDVSRSIAIGYGASMTDQHSVAVGDGSSVSKYNAVGLGSFANVSGIGGVAIGRQASSTATDAVALGHLAVAAFATSTAIGKGATTNAANQIMLGTSAETVVMPGNFDASNLPTTNPGAGSGLVWNNSGVLTVA